MAMIKIETQKPWSSNPKPRIFFTCHPEDFEKHFRRLCDDIFAIRDCEICYTRDMTATVTKGERDETLGQYALMVVPVTHRLLSTDNRTMRVDIPYAREVCMPVLPILMEPGLDEIYSQTEKFSNCQCLDFVNSELKPRCFSRELTEYLEAALPQVCEMEEAAGSFVAEVGKFASPEKEYAYGLCCLYGIGTEYQRPWGVERITAAAHSGWPEAMKKLCILYREGVVVERDERQAAQWAQKYLDCLTDRRGTESPETSDWMTQLARICIRRREYEKAYELLQQVYHIQSKTQGDLLPTLEYLTKAAEGLRDYLKIRNHLKERYRLAVQDDRSCLGTLNISIALRVDLGRIHETPVSEGLDRQINRQCCHHLEQEAPAFLITLSTLADAYLALDQMGRYLEVWYMAYHYCCRVFGEEHLNTLLVINKLSTYCLWRFKHDKALTLLQKQYTLSCKLLGPTHPETIRTLEYLASAYSKLSKTEEEIQTRQLLYQRSCLIWGKNDQKSAQYLPALINIYADRKEYGKKAEWEEKLYEYYRQTLGPENTRTLRLMESLAISWGNAEEHRKAAQWDGELYAIQCVTLGKDHSQTLNTLRRLIQTCNALCDYEQKLQLQEILYQIYCETKGENSFAAVVLLANIALTYGKLGDYEKEAQLEERAYALCLDTMGLENVNTQVLLSNLAVTYSALQDHSRALALAEESYRIRCRHLGSEHENTLAALKTLADLCYEAAYYHCALELFLKVYELECRLLGENHWKTLQTLKRIEKAAAGIAA